MANIIDIAKALFRTSGPELTVEERQALASADATAFIGLFDAAANGLESVAEVQDGLAGEAFDAAETLHRLAQSSEIVGAELYADADANRLRAEKIRGLVSV